MIRRFSLKLCAAIMIAACSPQETEAAEFTNKDFLELTGVQQKAMIAGIIEALWQVAAQRDRVTGKCVNEWYYSDAKSRDSTILATAKKYPDHTPVVVLMAITEKSCGKFVK